MYVYKNRGGGGAAENIIKAGTSNQLLYNDKEVILKENFLNLVYPVGSIYLSSNNTNPGTLFGGTWTQIKDKFILTAGDYYSNGATGGAATVTLTVSNMPSHKHSFTPSGTVGSHTHTGPSHTHSFTPSGTVSSHHHTGPSHSHSFTPSGEVSSHYHYLEAADDGYTSYVSYYTDSQNGIDSEVSFGDISGGGSSETGWLTTNSVKPSFTGTAGTTGAAGTGDTGDTAPSFSGTAGNTGAAGTGNTGETAPSFTGTSGYTDSNGSGSSFSILPPYVVKYCWERTA